MTLGPVTYAQIAAECGVDYRTVKMYPADDAPAGPQRGSSRKGTQQRVITAQIEAQAARRSKAACWVR